MRERGFSLVELLVVIAIIGIILSIASYNWNEMQKKSATESQVKMIYADLMELRLQAFYGKRARSVDISGQLYKAYSSTVITPVPAVTKQLKYPVVWNSSGLLTFDAQGATNSERTLCVLPTNDTAVINSAVVDSVIVSEFSSSLGKRTTGDCKSDNIAQ